MRQSLSLSLASLALVGLSNSGCIIGDNPFFELDCQEKGTCSGGSASGSGSGGNSDSETDGVPTGGPDATSVPTTTDEPTAGSVGGTDGETFATTDGPTTGEPVTGTSDTEGTTGEPALCQNSYDCQVGDELCNEQGECQACADDPDGVQCSELADDYGAPPRGCDAVTDPMTATGLAKFALSFAPQYGSCPGEDVYAKMAFILKDSPFEQAWSDLGPDGLISECLAKQIIDHLKDLKVVYGWLSLVTGSPNIKQGLKQQNVFDITTCGQSESNPLAGLGFEIAEQDCTINLLAGDPSVEVLDLIRVAAKATEKPFVGGEVFLTFTDLSTQDAAYNIQVYTAEAETGDFCLQPTTVDNFVWRQDGPLQMGQAMPVFTVYAP